MNPLQIFVAGRWCLAGIFILSAVAKILDPAKAIGQMTEKGLPMPAFLLAGAVGLLLIGSAALLSGKFLRYGVAALIVFLIPTTMLFHLDFPSERVAFFKNLAIFGGLLLVEAFDRYQRLGGNHVPPPRG